MINSAPRLFYVGNAVVDLVVTIPHLPPRGGDIIASSTTFAVGGGFNVMAAASRLGLPTVYAGTIGTGMFATLVRTALAGERISIVGPTHPQMDTGTVVVMVDDGGERTFVTSFGAEATLTFDQLKLLRPAQADIVAVTGYSLAHPAGAAAVAPWLAELAPDIVVVTDPGTLLAEIPVQAMDVLMARTDWWTCNSAEAAALTGHREPAGAAAELARRSGRAGVVVRDGAAGCWLATGGCAPVQIPGFAVSAIDTTGAGDAHTGAFIAALAQQADPFRAASRANAAAALAVTRRGPATAPDGQELDRFLAG